MQQREKATHLAVEVILVQDWSTACSYNKYEGTSTLEVMMMVMMMIHRIV